MTHLKRCSECGKMSDLTTTCTYPTEEEETIELCPTCLKEDGSFCLSCGRFCAGQQSFDFVHPGYCDTCWDEIEAECGNYDEEEGDDPNWYGDPYSDEEFPHGSLDY